MKIRDLTATAAFRLRVLVDYSLNRTRGEFMKKSVERQFTEPPVIIGGCGRSGTTLMLSVLSAHPEIFAVPVETGIFCSVEPRTLVVDWRYDLPYFYGKYFRDAPKGAKRWCEKTPANAQNLERIFDTFDPTVKVIHMIRDGRDVVLSRHPEDETRYWVDPERWVSDVRKALSFRKKTNVIEVRYEDLVTDYSNEIERIIGFLDLKDAGPLLDWHEHTTVKRNNAWSGEVKPIFNASVGKWRKPEYAERVKDFMSNEAAVALLRELGYE